MHGGRDDKGPHQMEVRGSRRSTGSTTAALPPPCTCASSRGPGRVWLGRRPRRHIIATPSCQHLPQHNNKGRVCCVPCVRACEPPPPIGRPCMRARHARRERTPSTFLSTPSATQPHRSLAAAHHTRSSLTSCNCRRRARAHQARCLCSALRGASQSRELHWLASQRGRLGERGVGAAAAGKKCLKLTSIFTTNKFYHPQVRPGGRKKVSKIFPLPPPPPTNT